MTSSIDVIIDSTYPTPFINNSSSGFRNNFANIKENLEKARDEIGVLHLKDMTFSGDLTGVSSKIQAGLIGQTAVLTLNNTGVTAGTYNTVNSSIELSVDSKGRILSFIRTPKTPDITFSDLVDFEAVVSPSFEIVESIVFPEILYDVYGNLQGLNAAAKTLNFGIVDHSLSKGSLIVGNGTDRSGVLGAPEYTYNPDEYYVLTWRRAEDDPVSDNFDMRWFKLPEIPVLPPQIGLLDEVIGGNGITIEGTEFSPEIKYDVTKFAVYPDVSALAANFQVLAYDSATGDEYRVKMSRIQEAYVPPAIITNSIAATYTIPSVGDTFDYTLTADTEISLSTTNNNILKEVLLLVHSAGFVLSFATTIIWGSEFETPPALGLYKLRRIKGVWYGEVIVSN